MEFYWMCWDIGRGDQFAAKMPAYISNGSLSLYAWGHVESGLVHFYHMLDIY